MKQRKMDRIYNPKSTDNKNYVKLVSFLMQSAYNNNNKSIHITVATTVWGKISIIAKSYKLQLNVYPIPIQSLISLYHINTEKCTHSGDLVTYECICQYLFDIVYLNVFNLFGISRRN